MKRGTLMFLKRLFVTALGALGLGVLATGPAFAQDVEPGTQIPGPKLYGDIASCAGGMLPTASTAMGSMSLLGMGGLLDQAFDANTTAMGIQIDYTADAARVVVGTDTTVTGYDSDLLALLSVADCMNPVANNVSEAVDLYNSYVSAKDTFEDLEEPDAEDTATYNTARMNKENFGGEVYNSVYDQQAKLAAARKAITDYNALVGSTGTLAQLKDNVDTTNGTAQTGGYDDVAVNAIADPGVDARVAGTTYRVDGFNTAPVGRRRYNALTGTDLHNNLNEQLAPVYGSGNTAGYRALRGNDDPTQTAASVDTTSGAFDTAGALQFEVGNTGTNAFSRASTDINTLGEIADELSRWQTLVDSAASDLEDAQDAGNLDTRAQEEALRRATLARDHVEGELDRLTRVVRSQNLEILDTNRVTIAGPDTTTTDDDTTYTNERDLVDAYLRSRGNAESAANRVKASVRSLDSSNRGVQSRLKDPGNYLNQLVTLREYQQTEREAELEEAGGDDALQSFKDAVTAARAAVTSAKAQRTAHQQLTSDPGSITSQLLNALLASEDPETDAFEDDDGQALLNAISGVDSKVDALEGQLTDADGNPIDLSNLGNAEEIAALTTDVSAELR